VLLGDAVLESETDPELVGRATSSFARGRENKLLLRDALLMTSGEVKRVFGCATLVSGFGPVFSASRRSIFVLLPPSRRQQLAKSRVGSRNADALRSQFAAD